MVFITEKTYFSKDLELVQHFTGGGGGVQLFRGGRSPIANFYGNSYHL